MKKIAENTWEVGTCVLKKVVGSKVTWYVEDQNGGLAGFDTKKAALRACETRNYWAEQ